MAQLAAEAEEHARFTSSINPSASSRPEDYAYTALTIPLTEETYDHEMRTLRNQQKRDRRDADEVNQLMVLECQALLRLFGLPYITAPMEAEAQCAELVELGLVDGIVTDDSDIFLFGGTRVYKNMFNQGKFVECYLLGDLERDFNLDRQKFINLAHLLGSDYAEGIPHVGPVNALELLSEFSNVNGLEDFRDWWIAVQQGRIPKDAGESEFRRKFRKNSTKVFLPMDFPNRIIDRAYLKPEVDHDPQGFVWGVPDLDALRNFLMAQIGWSKERTDEILVPVIKDMNRRQVFSTLALLTIDRRWSNQFDGIFRGRCGVRDLRTATQSRSSK
jgi:DNA excision repair protein ERCC-5